MTREQAETKAKLVPKDRCPRCGEQMSKYPALSRHANIDICSDCGVVEAINDMFHKPVDFEDWAF